MEQTVEVVYKKYRANGVRLVAEALEPASVPAIKDLMCALEEDVRFESLSLLLSPVVAGALQGELIAYVSQPLGDIDVAIEVMNPPQGSNPQLLYFAKSKFGAKKLVYVTSGLQSSVDFSEAERSKMDNIDVLIVNDELCAELYRLHYPWFDPRKIVVTGTSLIDAIVKEDGPGSRLSGRNKLEVNDDDIVLFFSAFPSSDFASYGESHTICTDALTEVIAGMRLAAEQQPQKKFVLLVRPHPRMSKSETEAMFGVCVSSLPNFVISTNTKLSFEESLYAAELIACMATSTLSNLSRYRGKVALVLAFSSNFCGIIFDKLFPPQQAALLEGVEGIEIVRNFESIAKAALNISHVKPPKIEGDSTQKLLECLLTE